MYAIGDWSLFWYFIEEGNQMKYFTSNWNGKLIQQSFALILIHSWFSIEAKTRALVQPHVSREIGGKKKSHKTTKLLEPCIVWTQKIWLLSIDLLLFYAIKFYHNNFYCHTAASHKTISKPIGWNNKINCCYRKLSWLFRVCITSIKI